MREEGREREREGGEREGGVREWGKREGRERQRGVREREKRERERTIMKMNPTRFTDVSYFILLNLCHKYLYFRVTFFCLWLATDLIRREIK